MTIRKENGTQMIPDRHLDEPRDRHVYIHWPDDPNWPVLRLDGDFRVEDLQDIIRLLEGS